MLFNSLVFLLYLPVVWVVWRVLPQARLDAPGSGRARRVWLLAASFVFYGWWDWRFLGLLVFSALVDYFVALLLDDLARPRRRAILTVSIVVNLTVLGVFKYLGFFTREAAAALAALGIHAPIPVLEVVLPVGLSFYTFQSMAYAIDVYRGEVRACRDVLDFLLFISFFPQLVAGPIERSHDLLPQLQRPTNPTRRQAVEGLWLVLWGYFKKVVVADNLAPAVAAAFDSDHPTGFAVLVGAYAFTWQIYCDFSGYSDIARGVARWMGVDLSLNFDLPFFATSPRDLWRRWHLSLSRWLRDYLYIPLGGNKHHTQRNLLLTMLLGGLWHGANWTFLAWGAYHGVALAVQRMVPAVKVPRPLAMLLTFHFTMLGFVVFRAHSVGQLGSLAAALGGGLAPGSADERASAVLLACLAVPVLAVEAVQLWADDALVILRTPRVFQAVAAAALALAIVMLGATYGAQFIYFQF